MSYYRRKFLKNMLLHRSRLRRFLTKVENSPPKVLDTLLEPIDTHLGMTIKQFKEKWLYKERSTGDWMNKSRPCQFLNRNDNKCTIYEVRPADCAEFPHLTKKKM